MLHIIYSLWGGEGIDHLDPPRKYATDYNINVWYSNILFWNNKGTAKIFIF